MLRGLLLQQILIGQYKMKVEQDSYEQYKKQLQQDLGISSIPSPHKPINTYMRYYMQRSAQERSKGQINIKQLSTQISEEWKTLSSKRKEFYQQIYQIRLRQHKALVSQFELLSNKRKILTPYNRFIKKRYLQYSKEHKNLPSKQITKLANQDWMSLPTKQKQRLNLQFQIEKTDSLLKIDKSEQINDYLDRLKRYHDLLQEDKDKILRKYGLTPEHIAYVKNQHRKKQNQMSRLLREERYAFKREEKKKYRELQRQKMQQEKQRIKTIKEEQRQKEKEILKIQRLKLKAQAEAKKLAEKEALREIKAVQKEVLDIQKKKKILPKKQEVPVQDEEEPLKKKVIKSKKIKKIATKKIPQKKISKQTKGKETKKGNKLVSKKVIKGKKIKRNK